MNMTTLSDLAEDLRDVIFDYYVSIHIVKCISGGPLTSHTVLAAEGNLQPKLHIDCESQVPCSEKTSDVDRPPQDAGRAYLYF